MYLTDYNLRNGEKIEVRMLRPACQLMGERIEQMAKQKCGNDASFTPIYKCSRYLRCTPFGRCRDEDIIHSCVGCESYLKPEFASKPAICDE